MIPPFTPRPCKTAQNAHNRVIDARLGSMTRDATLGYLLALRAKLILWLDELEKRIDKHPDTKRVASETVARIRH